MSNMVTYLLLEKYLSPLFPNTSAQEGSRMIIPQRSLIAPRTTIEQTAWKRSQRASEHPGPRSRTWRFWLRVASANI